MNSQQERERYNSHERHHEVASGDDELVVKFVDKIGDQSKDAQQNNILYSKSNLLQASINNFAFQTPNPNYYSTLG